MSKTAMIQLPIFIGEIDWKKFVLMFDSIIFMQENFDLGMKMLEKFSKLMPREFRRLYDFNMNNAEFLQEKNILKIVASKSFDSDDKQLENEILGLGMSEFKEFFDEKGEFIELDSPTLETLEKALNFAVRAASMSYEKTQETEVIPVVQQFYGSRKTKKGKVYRFLLGSIPEPKGSVSWEQILDFKADPDATRKYYRLINWINEVSKAELSDMELQDRYNALLSDYTESFRAHKMKYNRMPTAKYILSF